MKIPSNLSYTRDHEWLQVEPDGTARIGITDYAQDSLGDITFVELPEAGRTCATGEVFGVVESVKAASDLFMPVDGEVVEINPALEQAPETVNQDPYEGGWLIRIKLSDPDQLAALLSPEAYGKLTD